MKKVVFYFIALVTSLIYAFVARDTGCNHVSAFLMAFIPFGIIAGYFAWYLGKNIDA